MQEIEKEKAKQLRELEERRRVAAEAELSDIKVGIESRIRSAQEAAAREQKQNDEAAEADLRGELEAAIAEARSKLEQHRLLEAELQREQEGRCARGGGGGERWLRMRGGCAWEGGWWMDRAGMDEL